MSAAQQAKSETPADAHLGNHPKRPRLKAPGERVVIKKGSEMETVHPTEVEMRDAKVPSPETLGDLTDYIATLTDRPHDYGTCVYAMSMAATAAFNHVAHKLGVTGFQASCADMDILRRTRSLKGPFMIVDGANMLYPQCDIPGLVAETMVKWQPWAADEAAKLIDEAGDCAHPNVLAHWHKLAAYKEAP